MNPRFPTAIVIGLAVVIAANPAFLRAAAPEVTVRTTRVPDGGLYPQASTDGAGVLHLIYVKGDPMHGDIFYVRSGDAGRTFSQPLRVNSQPESCILTGTVRGPQMAVGKGGRVHVAWMGSDKAQPKAAGRQTPMLFARLNDAGDAFEPQRNLIQFHPGLDGGGSVAADAEGNVYVAWHAPLKEQNEQDRHVWVVRSRDEGKSFGAEMMADTDRAGVCGCCGMRIFAGAGKGEVYILYRSARTMVNRDMRLLVSSDHGQTFKLAVAHPWQIGQCVMSTSAFNAAADGAAFASWETKQQIYLAKVSADDVSEPPVLTAAPGEGKNRKHPTVAANGRGQFVLAWTEGTGWNQGGSVAWQVFEADGKPLPNQSGRAEGLPAWSAPAAVANPGGAFTIFY
jgi:hypothetical protein